MDLILNQYTRDGGWSHQLDATKDSENTLVILFGTSDTAVIDAALEDIRQTYPLSKTIGCSSAGEIYQQDICDDTLSIAIMEFANTRLEQALYQVNNNEDSIKAGEDIAKQLNQDELKGVFVLSDGLSVNGSALVEGLRRGLPKNVVITGGLAGDGDRFNETWVYSDHEVYTHHVAAIGFYGDAVHISHGSRGGWDVLGPNREVTRSENNVLYELDGQPALQLYKKYLGELAEGLPSTGLRFPLAIQNDEEVDGKTVRTILAVDETQQSITFAGDIPEGSYVQLMHANFDRLIDGASKAAEDALDIEHEDTAHLNIAISCVGRRLVLGQRAEEEIEATDEVFPENTQQIGFYSYGEISPLASGRCDLHNQTMTLTLISEQGSA